MLTVKIDTQNAAFEGPAFGAEVARILQIAAQIADVEIDERTQYKRKLYDSNGNAVGTLTNTIP